MITTTDPETDTRDNLTRLLKLGRRKRVRLNKRYSFFVRGMKLLLPLVALSIVVVVLAWPRMDETITPVPRDEIIAQDTGRNELINPRFESADKQNRPYTVTAARAEQSVKDSELVVLEKPAAEMILGPTEKFSGESTSGLYRQHAETLAMEGAVKLSHTNGYTLTSDKMNFEMKTGLAWTDTAVSIAGPDATLQAASMKADNQSGEVIFNGPAKLILKKPIKGLSR